RVRGPGAGRGGVARHEPRFPADPAELSLSGSARPAAAGDRAVLHRGNRGLGDPLLARPRRLLEGAVPGGRLKFAPVGIPALRASFAASAAISPIRASNGEVAPKPVIPTIPHALLAPPKPDSRRHRRYENENHD